MSRVATLSIYYEGDKIASTKVLLAWENVIEYLNFFIIEYSWIIRNDSRLDHQLPFSRSPIGK